MFASATGSSVCGVFECDSCDWLISESYKKHQLLPLCAFGPSVFAAVAVNLSTRASSTSLLLRRTAKFCRFRHLRQIWTSMSQFMSTFMVCGMQPRWSIGHSFYFLRRWGKFSFAVRREQLSTLKQKPVHVNLAVCGHSHIKCRFACSAVDWLPVRVLITLVHVINTNGQG